MKYQPIVPVSCLSLLDEWKNLFVLPELMLESKYRNYVTSRDWDLVIVENGFYELGAALPMKFLGKIADQFKGHAQKVLIVGPETSDPLGTIFACYPYSNDDRLLVIIKGRNVFNLFTWCSFFKNIGLVSKLAPHEGETKWYHERCNMVSRIKGSSPGTFIHCFGCDTLHELLELQRRGANSCDSSFPCSRAVHRVDMNKKSPRIDLMHEYTETQCDFMRMNLQTVATELAKKRVKVEPSEEGR